MCQQEGKKWQHPRNIAMRVCLRTVHTVSYNIIDCYCFSGPLWRMWMIKIKDNCNLDVYIFRNHNFFHQFKRCFVSGRNSLNQLATVRSLSSFELGDIYVTHYSS